MAEQPPLDHKSDQGEPKHEEDLVEANQRADRLEYIREFQEMMDQAFEKLLSKPVRRHPLQKDKYEPCTEQGKCKETICREAERQRGLHNQMSTEILTTSETVLLRKKQWIQTSVSKNL